MSDHVVVEVFKELAVALGRRTTGGKWVDDQIWTIQDTLNKAYKIVDAAKNQTVPKE